MKAAVEWGQSIVPAPLLWVVGSILSHAKVALADLPRPMVFPRLVPQLDEIADPRADPLHFRNAAARGHVADDQPFRLRKL